MKTMLNYLIVTNSAQSAESKTMVTMIVESARGALGKISILEIGCAIHFVWDRADSIILQGTQA